MTSNYLLCLKLFHSDYENRLSLCIVILREIWRFIGLWDLCPSSQKFVVWSLICRHCSFQQWYSHLEIVSALQWKTQSSLLGFQLGCCCKILFHKHNRWTVKTREHLVSYKHKHVVVIIAFYSTWRKKKSWAVYRWILSCHDYSNILLCVPSINLLLMVMSEKKSYSIWKKLAKGWVIGIAHWFMYFWKLKRGIFRLDALFGCCFFNLTLQTKAGSNSFIYGEFLGFFLWCCKLRSSVCNVKTC